MLLQSIDILSDPINPLCDPVAAPSYKTMLFRAWTSLKLKHGIRN